MCTVQAKGSKGPRYLECRIVVTNECCTTGNIIEGINTYGAIMAAQAELGSAIRLCLR